MQYLADTGAEVIKIEPPGGAFYRHWSAADGAAVGSNVLNVFRLGRHPAGRS